MSAQRIELLQVAITYTRLSWSVIPIEPRGKRPLVKWRGRQNMRLTEPELEAYWQRWPEANVGVVTGHVSGLLVLDIDEDKGGLRSLAKLVARHGPMPLTWRCRTGSGQHLYFLLPEGRDCRNSAGRLGPGLDIRAEGGYVVAPPSIHRSGRQYRWLDGGPL
jgi:hypothetical protein